MLFFDDYSKIGHKNFVATIGNFDGMHKGHIAIIQKTIQISKEEEIKSLVCSFYPHPNVVIRNMRESEFLLQSFKNKIKMLEQMGVDYFLQINLNVDFLNTSADSFVRDILVEHIGIKHLVIGCDFRFGKDRLGEYSLLKQIGKEFNFFVHVLSKKCENHSSSSVRKQLSMGNVREVSDILGREYTIDVNRNRYDNELNALFVNICDDVVRPKAGYYSVNIFSDCFVVKNVVCFCPQVGGLILYIDNVFVDSFTVEFIDSCQQPEHSVFV